MNPKDLKDNFKFIDEHQLKVSKWWLVFAWIFGKRFKVEDNDKNYYSFMKVICFRGKTYCYKSGTIWKFN